MVLVLQGLWCFPMPRPLARSTTYSLHRILVESQTSIREVVYTDHLGYAIAARHAQVAALVLVLSPEWVDWSTPHVIVVCTSHLDWGCFSASSRFARTSYKLSQTTIQPEICGFVVNAPLRLSERITSSLDAQHTSKFGVDTNASFEIPTNRSLFFCYPYQWCVVLLLCKAFLL